MFVRRLASEHLFPFVKQPRPVYAVTIAVSSRTLFNMVAERKVYEEEGVEKYVAFQVENENEPLKPGAAFPFVKVRGWCVSGVCPLLLLSSTKHVQTTSLGFSFARPFESSAYSSVVIKMLHLKRCVQPARC